MANATLTRQQGANPWNQFCDWVSSTDNRLYVGWFGTLMIPTLLAATVCFLVAFIGTSRRYSTASVNQLVHFSTVTTSSLVHCSFLNAWTSLLSHLGSASLDEWLYNGGPYQLVVFHFLIGVFCYMGREWELSYRLGMRPGSVCVFSSCGCHAKSSSSIPSVKDLSLMVYSWY